MGYPIYEDVRAQHEGSDPTTVEGVARKAEWAAAGVTFTPSEEAKYIATYGRSIYESGGPAEGASQARGELHAMQERLSEGCVKHTGINSAGIEGVADHNPRMCAEAPVAMTKEQRERFEWLIDHGYNECYAERQARGGDMPGGYPFLTGNGARKAIAAEVEDAPSKYVGDFVREHNERMRADAGVSKAVPPGSTDWEVVNSKWTAAKEAELEAVKRERDQAKHQLSFTRTELAMERAARERMQNLAKEVSDRHDRLLRILID